MTREEEGKLGDVLRDETASLAKRFRALFALRNVSTDESVDEISKAFSTESVLLKHELAYVLGQMANPRALGALKDVLENGKEDEIARHEAAEAIANFRDPRYLDVLRKYSDRSVSNSTAVAETCQIGVALMKDRPSGRSPFGSLDPAPADEEDDIEVLEKAYLDEDLSLHRRYMAMFKLRNICTDKSVEVIAKGFHAKKRSDLFEHEIAFVYGQMGRESAVKHLRAVIEDLSRHEMVRHECAEALGSIGGDEAVEVLKSFQGDKSPIVRESVEVALDIHSHKFNDEDFEYATA